jgi:hypothetical protein
MGATLRRRCGFGSTFGSTSVSFSAPLPGARVTSLCLAKEKSPRERPPRCCVFRPSMDEKSVRVGQACRRAIPGAAASGRNPLRPPSGPSRPALTTAQGPRKSFDSMAAILASLKARSSELLRPLSAQDARRKGPLERGGRRTEKSEGWPAGCGPVRRRHMDVPSANPGGRSRILSTGMCSGRVRGVAFSLVTFSWPSKRKLPAPWDGAEKDRDVDRDGAMTLGFPRMKPVVSPTYVAALPMQE